VTVCATWSTWRQSALWMLKDTLGSDS
ncbi:uncharacterized protein METZ01_LOCUS234205, partial [marine metagenome]